MPSQLSKENKKFIYGVVREGGRAKDFELAIQWLVDAGLVLRVPRVSTPAMPLNLYEDISTFKLYLLDVGLLGALAGTPAELLLMPNNMGEGKGMFTENYVCTQLVAGTGRLPFYYSRENSRLEIDFVVQYGTQIVPVEVKAEENISGSSLSVYFKTYAPHYRMRFSMLNLQYNEGLLSSPAPLVGWLDKWMSILYNVNRI